MGQIMEIEIHGSGSELQGVGRAPDGRAVFVKGALPGERVRVREARVSARFMEAELQAVLSPSPHRRAPQCPLYETCGGCQALHMDYEYSLFLKRQRVTDALERLGGFESPHVLPILGMESPFHYRNKAEYAIESGPHGARVGFRAPMSHRVIDAPGCLLQHPLSLGAARVLREWLAARPDAAALCRALVTRVTGQGQVMAVLCTGPKAPREMEDLGRLLFDQIPGMKSFYHLTQRDRPRHALDGRARLMRGERVLTDGILGLEFEISPQSFFQVNPTQTQALYTQALEAARLTGRELVHDAYCGAGTISLIMARQARHVVGVEIVESAILDARENARRNGLEHKSEFILGDAAQILPGLKGGRPDVICVDPPRKGVDAGLIEAIRKSGPERVVYVSCNPATLARDLKLLCAGGAFRLESVRPVDMFPWTGHVETVVLLSKLNTKQHIEVELNLDELDLTAAESKATYDEIKAYVLEKHGLKVSSLYISQVKRKCGLDVGQNYNLSKKEDAKVPQCPPEKEAAIMEALKHFQMIM